MGAKSRAARKTRVTAEFDTSLAPFSPPKFSSGVALTSWTLAQIFAISEAENIPTSVAADRLAEERMGRDSDEEAGKAA